MHIVSADLGENIAELIFDEGRKKTMLLYGGHTYLRHSNQKDVTYWRCPSNYKGCRALLSARYVGGYLMVNKSKEQIIHSNHVHKTTEKWFRKAPPKK